MREVVIAGYLRTAQSRSRPNDPARDWFHKLRADFSSTFDKKPKLLTGL